MHTGEVELIGEDIGGIGVHMASRVCGVAGGGQVLTSGTVRDLVAGSGIEFESLGSHHLKGVTDDAELFLVAATPLTVA